MKTARSVGRAEFVSLDVETTGLHPQYLHRVVEVALCSFDAAGRQGDEYVTLVNPRRDVSNTFVHGLAAEQLAHAPDFATVAGDVLHMLHGRVVIAHNASFDLSFLGAELQRAGFAVPHLPAICTMTNCARHGWSRRLVDVCRDRRIQHVDPHSAMGDARATRSLFLALLEEDRALQEEADKLSVAARSLQLPLPDRSGLAVGRSAATAAAQEEKQYLARLVALLPPGSTDGAIAPYLAMLDRALEDRLLTQEEVDSLLAVATHLGLSRVDVEVAHESYFSQLCEAAWSDGVVTHQERIDLQRVATFLGIDAGTAERLLEIAMDRRKAGRPAGESVETSLAGLTVCFTGALLGTVDGQPITRELAHSMAAAAGLEVKDSVTRKLDILVVADPHSESGKAKKARSLGTRVLAESVFWRLIGARVD